VDWQVGPWRVTYLPTGEFGMDGGASFGLIPRPLWERVTGPPDAANRLFGMAPSILLRAGSEVILVDTGLGWKLDERTKSIHCIRNLAPSWVEILAPHNLTPNHITQVILTHLHFDHCGGTTLYQGEGILTAAFPQARHWIQKSQWEWAHSQCPRDRASYRNENYDPILEQGLLNIVDGPDALHRALASSLPTDAASSLEIFLTNGHTPGLQSFIVHGMVLHGPTMTPCAQGGLLFAVDLIPSRAHLHPLWTPAFDHLPLISMEEKQHYLERCAKEDLLLIPGHEGMGWPDLPYLIGLKVSLSPKGPTLEEAWVVPRLHQP
jgi:glyoxylase-like metal-dependent hydrolase (beta-lactamase superfamily II)